MTQELLFDKRGDIGWITFNRPAQRNALTFAMYEGLAEICGRIARTGEAKALVITGAGDKAFAAGTDIAQFQDFWGGEDGIAYECKMDRILDAIERCPVPPLPHRRFLHRRRGRHRRGLRPQDRRRRCPVRLPDRPHPGELPLYRQLRTAAALIGPQRVKEMLLLARMIDGPTARELGLLSELLPNGPALHARAAELAQTVAGHARSP